MTAAPTNWQTELDALLLELGPGLYFSEVRHDPWCAFLAGRGPCNCLPDIVVERFQEKDAGPAQSRGQAEDTNGT